MIIAKAILFCSFVSDPIPEPTSFFCERFITLSILWQDDYSDYHSRNCASWTTQLSFEGYLLLSYQNRFKVWICHIVFYYINFLLYFWETRSYSSVISWQTTSRGKPVENNHIFAFRDFCCTFIVCLSTYNVCFQVEKSSGNVLWSLTAVYWISTYFSSRNSHNTSDFCPSAFYPTYLTEFCWIWADCLSMYASEKIQLALSSLRS